MTFGTAQASWSLNITFFLIETENHPPPNPPYSLLLGTQDEEILLVERIKM